MTPPAPAAGTGSSWTDGPGAPEVARFLRGPQRRGFEFFVNPLGVQMDLFQNEVTGGEDESWDTIWDSAGRLTESGYEVEMTIPFSSIRFPRTDGVQTWGVDAIRIHPRDQRRHADPDQGRGRPGGISQQSVEQVVVRNRHADESHNKKPGHAMAPGYNDRNAANANIASLTAGRPSSNHRLSAS